MSRPGCCLAPLGCLFVGIIFGAFAMWLMLPRLGRGGYTPDRAAEKMRGRMSRLPREMIDRVLRSYENGASGEKPSSENERPTGVSSDLRRGTGAHYGNIDGVQDDVRSMESADDAKFGKNKKNKK